MRAQLWAAAKRELELAWNNGSTLVILEVNCYVVNDLLTTSIQ